MSAFVTTQQKTLAILPKFTGFFSFIGSSFILYDISKNPINSVYHRLMIGLSLSDMVASFVNILSTWPIPAGTPGVFLASGTTQTCTAQGFFNELGNVCTPLYNASLAVYYVLVIRNGWAEDRIRSRAEPLLHLTPTIVATVIAALGLPFKLYNNAGWFCWVAPFPKDCQTTDEECIRGENADIFVMVHYLIIWSAILFVTMGMYAIYRSVKFHDQALPNESVEEVARRGMRAKKVAIQAGLFVGALYLTWIFATIARIYQISNGRNNYPLLILMAIFFPLQGFFNALIYIRPRYLMTQVKYPLHSRLKLFWLALFPEEEHVASTSSPIPEVVESKVINADEESGDSNDISGRTETNSNDSGPV